MSTVALARVPATRPVGLLGASRAAGRSGLRAARAALFLTEAAAWVRRHFDLPAAGAAPDLSRRVGYLKFLAENLCALHGIDVRVRGALPTAPCVLVANHLGYIDPLALSTALPCAPIAKTEVGDWPLLGETMRRLGVIFVDRGCPHSGAAALLRARAALQAGVSVLVFPEGTTSVGDDVLPLARGAFGLARLCAVPVVPIAVRHESRRTAWVDDQTFVPHYFGLASQPVTRITVDFDPPLTVPANADASRLAADARTILRRKLALP